MKDMDICRLAQLLVQKVRRNTTIDWNLRESARAEMRLLVKKTLRQHGYPPDWQKEAINRILAQAEAFAAEGEKYE